METIELTKEKEYGIEIVIKDTIRKYPGIVDIKVDKVTHNLIFCKLFLKRELVEETGGLKISDSLVERKSPFIYLSTIYFTYSDSEEKENAKKKLDKYEKKIINEMNKIYEKLPKNLVKYGNFNIPLSFSFTTFFIV